MQAVIRRSDNLPSCCIVCGESPTRLLRLKFSKRDRLELTDLLLPKLFRRMLRTFPSIVWSLPLCNRHAWSFGLRQRFQFLLVLSGYAALGVGIWSVIGTNLTWPFIVSAIASVLFIVGAQHTAIVPRRVNRHVLECDRVDEHFVEELIEFNQAPPFEGEPTEVFFGGGDGSAERSACVPKT